MGIFSKKNSDKEIDEIQNSIQNYVNNTKSDESIVFLRAVGHGSKLRMRSAQIRATIETLPKMLINLSKSDESFGKSLIAAAITLMDTDPEYKDFSNKLRNGVNDLKGSNSGMSQITDALKKKFPGAEVQAIDLSKLDEMPKDAFDKMINNIFKASKDKNNGSESNKD